jgi:hypothetical protein
MPNPGLRAVLILSCAMAPLAGAASAASISSAQEGWNAITACARTPDDEARRDCMDGVLRRAGLLNLRPGDAVATNRDEARPAPPPPPSASRPTLLGVPLPSAGDDSTGPLTVAKSQIDYDGKVLITTSDGQRWRAQDVGAPRPKAGQAIAISSSVMNSYECRLSKWESFLCVKDGSGR